MVHAQLEDVSLDYLIEATTFGSLFGCGLSTADFNGDGWDDVTTSGSDGWIKLYTGGPEGFTPYEAWQVDNEGKAVLWVDIENDGDLDLFVGVLNIGVFLYVQQSDGSLVEEGLARGMPVLQMWDVRGFSARDYDRDGDLDLYIASYHDLSQSIIYENMLFMNGGNGYFEDVTLISGAGNGHQHSFQGAWMDFDGNGFDDLWVINDRSIFPNALYSNTGNGNFIDISAESGANIGIEAMSATLFDPDNDGDWDQYVTNIENNPNAFLRNNDGVYVDIADAAGVASLQYGWGTCAIDVDGDRWDDMMVATYRFPNTNPYDNHLYMNLGSGTEFEDVTENWPNEQFQLYCLGRLDLDQDRVPDVVGHGNANHAQVLRNTNINGAARMTVNLVGTESNTRAVGSVIKVHANGLSQMRQVEAGCDYMTQHTYTRFFALGDETMVDSLEVFWPTGNREVLYDLATDTALVIVEGTASAHLEPIETPCPWSSGGWVVPFDPETTDMTWNGVPVTSEVVTADSAGQWTLEATWWGGGVTWSETVDWTPEPDPEWTLSVQDAACHGGSGNVSWSVSVGSSITVADTTLTNLADSLVLPAGEYLFSAEVESGCFIDSLFVVQQPEALFAEAEVMHPQCHGDPGSTTVVYGGGTPPLTIDFPQTNPVAMQPGTWTYVIVDSMGCGLLDSVTVVEPDPLVSEVAYFYEGISDSVQVVLTVSGGTQPYDIQWTGEQDSAGWVMAPIDLGWYVEDANGCLDLGVVSIASNPLAGVVGQSGDPGWMCTRSASTLSLEGPGGRGATFSVLDLSGRFIVHDTPIGASFKTELPYSGRIIVCVKDESGEIHRWVK